MVSKDLIGRNPGTESIRNMELEEFIGGNHGIGEFDRRKSWD
jgi:hypothetical protein